MSVSFRVALWSVFACPLAGSANRWRRFACLSDERCQRSVSRIVDDGRVRLYMTVRRVRSPRWSPPTLGSWTCSDAYGAPGGADTSPTNRSTTPRVHGDPRRRPFRPERRQPPGWRVAVVDDLALRRRARPSSLGRCGTSISPSARPGSPRSPSLRPTAGSHRATVPTTVPNPLIDDIEGVPVDARRGRRSRPGRHDGQGPRPSDDRRRSVDLSVLLEHHPGRSGPRARRGDHDLPRPSRARGRPAARACPRDWAIAATIFLGHPVHQPTKLRRDPVEEFTFVDRFDGRPYP